MLGMEPMPQIKHEGQIRVPTREPNRVFADPHADLRIIPPVEIVLQTGRVVEQFAGEAEDGVDGRVGLGGDVAKSVVGLVVLHDARVVHQIADGAQVVGERPQHLAVGLVVRPVDLLVGQQLIHDGAPNRGRGVRLNRTSLPLSLSWPKLLGSYCATRCAIMGEPKLLANCQLSGFWRIADGYPS